MSQVLKYFFTAAIFASFLFALFNSGTAQNTIMTEKLETALFPDNQDSVLLIEYLKDCRNHRIDSSIYIRKNQPNYKHVMNIMEEILHSGDTSQINPLMIMYDKFVDIFEKEWQKVNKENLYPCDSVRNQINMMEGFERIIKGLYLKYITSKEKFEFFFDEFLLRRHLSNSIINDSTYRLKYKYINEKYLKIISPQYFQGFTPFNYIDPYIDEIAPFVIKKIKENKVIPYFASDEERFLFSNYTTIAKIKDPAMIEALKEVLRHDTLGNKTKTWTFVHYLAENHDEELVELVIEKLAKDFPDQPKEKLQGYYSRTISNHILKVEENEVAVLQALVNLSQKNADSKEKAKQMIEDVGVSKIKSLLDKHVALPKEILKEAKELILEIPDKQY